MQNQENILLPRESDDSPKQLNYWVRTDVSVFQGNENQLWKNLKKGDESSLGELYNMHIDDLFSYGVHLAQDRSLVMDCIHDLFVDLFKYRKNISIKGNGKNYLFLCLKRNIYRKNKKQTVTLSEEYDFTLGGTYNCINSHEETIVKNERRSEQVEKLSTALDKLTKKQKKSIQLRYIQERTYEEISEIMGVSVQTARTTIYRALKSLRT